MSYYMYTIKLYYLRQVHTYSFLPDMSPKYSEITTLLPACRQAWSTVVPRTLVN